MLGLLQRFTRPQRPERPERSGAPTGAAAVPAPAARLAADGARPPAVAAAAAMPEAARPGMLAWLLDAPPPGTETPAPAAAAAQAAAQRAVEDLLEQRTLPAGLLPRAAAVVPQLLAMLRQEAPSRSVLAQQVARDAVLAAEVLRLARSPLYRTRAPVESLDAALAMLGTAGLQAAIARVVLKPVFDGSGGGLAARAAGRLWQHAEQESELAAALAGDSGLGRLDAFLAGLLHGSGWTIALRAIDRAGLDVPPPLRADFDAAMERLHERLFARVLVEWQLTPGLSALAAAVERAPLYETADPLARVLAEADRRCRAERSGDSAAG